MNKTIKKLVIAVVALSLALVGVVGGVIAWLVAESDPVTNTFTVGNIEIDLNETDTDNDGDSKANAYKVVPGNTDEKQPYVTVKAKSEDCYVYVAVTNNLVLEIDGSVKEVASFNWSEDWELVKTLTKDGINTYLYRYETVVEYSETAQNTAPVFTEVTYAGEEIVLDNINDLNQKTVVIKAYAHQFDNVDQDDADAAAIAWATELIG